MAATATFPSVHTSATQPSTLPVVFVEGRPTPELTVNRYATDSPLGRREITVTASKSRELRHWRNRSASIAIPRAIAGGEVRWQVLSTGRLSDSQGRVSVGHDAVELRLSENWAEALSQIPETFWAVDSHERIVRANSLVFGVGRRANRSTERHSVGGRWVYLPSTENNEWAIEQVIATLDAVYRLSLDPLRLASAMRHLPLTETIELSGPADGGLADLLTANRLFVDRRFTGVEATIGERRVVRPLVSGRSVSISFPKADRHRGIVSKFEVAQPDTGPRRWVAYGSPPVVESTFDLIPGWDATLEGGSPDAYDPAGNPDFSRYVNVYRRWVLNEDAQADGPVFDLASFFGQPGLAPTPRRFGPCVAQDDAERPLSPVLEYSLDVGVTWVRLTGGWSVLADRAGVLVTEGTLASGWIDAAAAGSLRLRLTASLTSPNPIEAARWRGNPFGTTRSPVVLDWSDRFARRQVAAASIHHAAVRAGTLGADERDDTAAMADRLVRRLDQEEQTPSADPARIELTLTGVRPEWRVGDRLRGVLGPGRDAQGEPSGVSGHGATVVGVRCDFNEQPRTVITLAG
ncbi:MAG: hypothetical protein AAFX76_02080 [Planctomycetota bacterium]